MSAAVSIRTMPQVGGRNRISLPQNDVDDVTWKSVHCVYMYVYVSVRADVVVDDVLLKV